MNAVDDIIDVVIMAIEGPYMVDEINILCCCVNAFLSFPFQVDDFLLTYVDRYFTGVAHVRNIITVKP